MRVHARYAGCSSLLSVLQSVPSNYLKITREERIYHGRRTSHGINTVERLKKRLAPNNLFIRQLQNYTYTCTEDSFPPPWFYHSHLATILSTIDGNSTSPGFRVSSLAASSSKFTPVRNVGVRLVILERQDASEGGASSSQLERRPTIDRLEKASTMSRLRQSSRGPTSNTDHLLLESSIKTCKREGLRGREGLVLWNFPSSECFTTTKAFVSFRNNSNRMGEYHIPYDRTTFRLW